MTPLMGTFVKLQTMADGTPRIVIDMQCSLAEVVAMNLEPGAPLAIARLLTGTPAEGRQEEAKPKGGPLAKLAGMWCEDGDFLAWIGKTMGPAWAKPEQAAACIRHLCSIESRADLDSNEEAARLFQETFRGPFMEWMRANRRGEMKLG